MSETTFENLSPNDSSTNQVDPESAYVATLGSVVCHQPATEALLWLGGVAGAFVPTLAVVTSTPTDELIHPIAISSDFLATDVTRSLVRCAWLGSGPVQWERDAWELAVMDNTVFEINRLGNALTEVGCSSVECALREGKLWVYASIPDPSDEAWNAITDRELEFWGRLTPEQSLAVSVYVSNDAG